MSKYYVLLTADNNKRIRKVWVSDEQVIDLLNRFVGYCIFRTSTDQYASLRDDGIVWIDVKPLEFESI
jgi:hypothetical protein